MKGPPLSPRARRGANRTACMESLKAAHISNDGLESLGTASDEDGHQHRDGDIAAELEHLYRKKHALEAAAMIACN